MRPEVDFADVVVAQHSGISSVGCVVSCAVVDRAAGGKGQTRTQSVLLDELSGTVFQPLTGSNKEIISFLPLDASLKQPPRIKRWSQDHNFTTLSHQMSIMVMPGLIQLLTYERTCRWASAACLKSLHISSLARSRARFSSLVVRHVAVRLMGMKPVLLGLLHHVIHL